MAPLIQEPVTIDRIAPADRVYLSHPSILALPGGRILASVDAQGPDVRALPGQKCRFADTNHWMQGRLFASQDEGKTWTQKLEYPFGHACLFRDGNQLYLLGHRGPLVIIRSSDGGETWSKPVELIPKGGDNAVYSHSPCSVLHANGRFEVVMLRTTGDYQRRVTPHTLVPILLRAPEGFNLTVSKSWTWSEPGPTLSQALSGTSPTPELPLFEKPAPTPTTPDAANHAPGWMHPHAVAITNPRHAWHDASGHTTHVLFAAPSPRGNAAIACRFTEQAGGTLRADLPPTSATGRPLWIPLPGGNRPFHLLADGESQQHWLVSTQHRGSLLRTDTAPGQRAITWSAHPHLLELNFSSNLVDWTSAGWVGGTPSDPLTEPAIDIRGKDLCVVACARDADDPATRHAKRLVFGIIRNFRSLMY